MPANQPRRSALQWRIAIGRAAAECVLLGAQADGPGQVPREPCLVPGRCSRRGASERWIGDHAVPLAGQDQVRRPPPAAHHRSTLSCPVGFCRIRDDKAGVRKTAIQMLGTLLKQLILEMGVEVRAPLPPCFTAFACGPNRLTNVGSLPFIIFHRLSPRYAGDRQAIDPNDVSIIAERCRDAALNTRRAALQTLTQLVIATPESELLRETWVVTALPMVLDQAPSAVELCCQTAHSVIIGALRPLPAPKARARPLAHPTHRA